MEKTVTETLAGWLIYKNKQTEVAKWHQISGEPVSIFGSKNWPNLTLFERAALSNKNYSTNMESRHRHA